MHSPSAILTSAQQQQHTVFPAVCLPPHSLRDSAMSSLVGVWRFFSCFPSRSHRVSGAGAAPVPASGGEEDLISCLPNDVLSYIISFLPIKDAARTAVLSPRWRGIWASTPLAIDDVDLLLLGTTRFTHVAAVTATVAGAIRAHPGPFRAVTLTCYFTDTDKGTLHGWIRELAAKGVQELTLNNIPWASLDVLPCALFGGCSSVQRLAVSGWRFPDTAAAAAGEPDAPAAFPCLRELVISRGVIGEQDLERVLGWSPRLETLVLVLSRGVPERVRLRGGSLRCVVFWQSVAEELAVVAAPLLERLIIQPASWRGSESDHLMRIKISSASVLRVLGYLNPNCHELQIGDTVITVGKKAMPDAVVPSVKILALAIRFGIIKEAGMMQRFLGCFPNIETLHVLSVPDHGPTSTNGNFQFWNGIDSVECVKESIKEVVIHGFRGENCEIQFIRSILECGKVFQKIYILRARNIFVSDDDINDDLNLLDSLNWGTTVTILAGQDGNWTFEMAYDRFRIDPFDRQSSRRLLPSPSHILCNP